MNDNSSRSHFLFFINLERNDKSSGTVSKSTLCVVDLAGSERLKRTKAQEEGLKEANSINSSLTNLGIVINQIVKKKKYVSFRDSKLTRILKNSFGGNSITSLIITVSQMTIDANETGSTLRFGKRAKEIKNAPKIQREMTQEQMKE